MVVKDWITAGGLRAVILQHRDCGHLCGYVEVPVGHPLHGVYYSDETPVLASAAELASQGPVGKRGMIPLFCAALTGAMRPMPQDVFDVHGSLTFADSGKEGYPVLSDGWWFGFDCNHLDDRDESGAPNKDANYVASECESLARQIVEATSTEGRTA